MLGRADIRGADTPEELAREAATFISERLALGLEKRGRASLALSGGSSPQRTHEILGDIPLAWESIGVSLVDERWVPPGEEGSNADFIRKCFEGRPAARAHFVPLYNGHDTPADGLDAAEQAIASLCQPYDVCILGMGMDGHTASWFPYGPDLAETLSPGNPNRLCAIDATGQAGAGGYPDRLSLTFSAIAAAQACVLLLPTAEKFEKFSSVFFEKVESAPVSALSRLEARLHVFAVGVPS